MQEMMKVMAMSKSMSGCGVVSVNAKSASDAIMGNSAENNTYKPQLLRTGLGMDVHAFAHGRLLILGGVDIPYKMGLQGHSDADVLVHAIMDALLGAARLGDIGKLFPDTCANYKDANSLELASNVAARVMDAGFEILDIDCVIAAQEPKLSPYRDQMRENIAHALNISIDNIGIKATTTEHLGFEGRGEGISAWAVCLLTRK